METEQAVAEQLERLFENFGIKRDRIDQVLEKLSPIDRPEDKDVVRWLFILLSVETHTRALIVLGRHYTQCQSAGLPHDKGLVDRCIKRAIEFYKPRPRPLP